MNRHKIRLDLKEYFGEAKDAYSEAIEAFTKMDSEVYDEVKSVRSMHELEIGILSNNLLLILAINQPLMEDLRIVATYLRTVDTVERVVRHASAHCCSTGHWTLWVKIFQHYR